MGLNIKNDEAHELATELARLTGKSKTAVVIDSLRLQLEQLKRYQDKETRLEELMAIGQRCAAHLSQPLAAVQHGDILYNQAGMPE